MLLQACPKLPTSNVAVTKNYYVEQLGFALIGDYENYLLLKKDALEIHFFEFPGLQVSTNYGQVYIRVKDIRALYDSFLAKKINIHPNGKLEQKPWGQMEFSLLDPHNNLLTFGESLI